MKKLWKEEHCGFAVTLEVMCTLVMLFAMIIFIVFLMMVMNAQRFMNTIMTSTAVEASRWGGNNTRSYQINTGEPPIQNTAQAHLDAIVPEYNASITVTPERISTPGERVYVTVRYHLPSAWQTIGTFTGGGAGSSPPTNAYNRLENRNGYGQGLTMSVSVCSVTKAGALIP